MKKTLLLAAALACSGAVAQEKQVWACQQTEGTMLNWEGGAWRQRAIIPTDTGRMGLSYLLGVLSSSPENRDSVAAIIYNCTKF